MFTGKIIIKETDETDLVNIMNLWNNGEVMNFVGFPIGMGYNFDKIKNWYKKIKKENFLNIIQYIQKNLDIVGKLVTD